MTQEQRIEALEQQVSEMKKQLTEIKQAVTHHQDSNQANFNDINAAISQTATTTFYSGRFHIHS